MKWYQLNFADNSKSQKFAERFEVDNRIDGTGSFVLTSVGCTKRYQQDRKEAERTPAEEMRVATGQRYTNPYRRDNWRWAPKYEVKRMIKSIRIIKAGA